MLLEPASARTPTVRKDPNDSAGGLDIRAVSTSTTPKRLVLWIGMWDRLHASEDWTSSSSLWTHVARGQEIGRQIGG